MIEVRFDGATVTLFLVIAIELLFQHHSAPFNQQVPHCCVRVIAHSMVIVGDFVKFLDHMVCWVDERVLFLLSFNSNKMLIVII